MLQTIVHLNLKKGKHKILKYRSKRDAVRHVRIDRIQINHCSLSASFEFTFIIDSKANNNIHFIRNDIHKTNIFWQIFSTEGPLNKRAYQLIV